MLTPCILVCSLDESTGYCLGCGRTGAEIGAWISYSDDERRRIMDILPERMTKLALKPGGDDRRSQRARERSAV
ncbi:DUF1289 domain-containing protein [Rhizobium lusitanum]|uniref:DUF1289 domain-containing protein n=1 Tax=Rhizobium lusitanum TaxID=293958 RepID=UPI00161554F2|nr:DUF1289 domain-containing protein [Rhizobium lusitanum]